MMALLPPKPAALWLAGAALALCTTSLPCLAAGAPSTPQPRLPGPTIAPATSPGLGMGMGMGMGMGSSTRPVSGPANPAGHTQTTPQALAAPAPATATATATTATPVTAAATETAATAEHSTPPAAAPAPTPAQAQAQAGTIPTPLPLVGPQPIAPPPEHPGTQAQWVEKGRYLAAAADCAACHTTPNGQPYAGNVAFSLPIGTLYASNITPDKTYGIGTWSEAQFTRAVREGVRPDGATLYPAMPYPSYARMTDTDLHALYVYFMHGVQPVAQPAKTNGIAWPLSMRFPLVLWRWAFAPSPQAARNATLNRAYATPQLARGAYLVEGPGHCGACHTERGLAMQEKALTARDGPQYLAGGKAVDGWVPPSLRGEAATGLGAWSAAEITAFLQTGRTTRGSVFGSMGTAVHHGTQYLTMPDLAAMAAYLKTLPAATQQAPYTPNPAATQALLSGGTLTQGQQLYRDNCAACHRANGAGFAPVFPPLAGNPVVQTPSPESVVRIMLAGSTLEGTQQAPSSFSMPGFAARLTNAQLASLATFIRQAWGNTAPAVTEQTVRQIRKTLPPAGQ